jgi:hypothetical protein
MVEQIDPTIASKIEHHEHPVKRYEPDPDHEPKTRMLIWFVLAVALLFVIVMMLRTVYNPAPPEKKVMYNGFEFVQLVDGFWQFRWQKGNEVYNVPLRYNPAQLDNVTVVGSLDPRFATRPEVYVAVDPSNASDQQYVGLGVGETGLNLLKAFNVNLVAACTRNETDACTVRPIVSCEKDSDKSIIVIREGDGPTVIHEGSCIIVRGDKMDLLQSVDRLLYRFYGVMD